MIEIVCPSCGARYQVPDDSIGPDGRKVTCSSCSHKWRASPPAAAAAPPAEAESPAPSPVESAESASGPPAGFTPEAPAETPPEAPPEARPAADAEEPGDATAAPQPGAEGGREEQMDTIRRMLDDLKRSAESEPEPGPGPEPEPEPRPAAPPPSARRREEPVEFDDDAGRDPLRSRINQLERGGAKEARPSNYDAARLRKMHERRAKRLQRAKARKRGSGAFLTGFTLVTAVAATMVVLYVMSPRIIAASPEMAPAMNEYVVAVDRYRSTLDGATAEWRGWLIERVGQLTSGEESQGETQAETQGETQAETQGETQAESQGETQGETQGEATAAE